MGFIHSQLFPHISIGDFSQVKTMSVINLSPESFYQESYIPNESISQQISNSIKMGATFIDLGARSTAPWSKPITLFEEKERINNALQALPDNIPKNVAISIDTQHSDVAQMAIEMGNEKNLNMLINDVSAFTTDKKLINIVVENKIPCIIMASEAKPGDTKTIREIMSSLEKTQFNVKKAISNLNVQDYDTSKIIIDPGIGKWVKEKTYEYDLSILDNLEDFRAFGLPILVGLSRKSFIGTTLGEKKPLNRDFGSYASTSIAVYNGAHIIRTHDINKQMNQTIEMASAIRKKPIYTKIASEKQTCEYIKPMNYTRSAYHFLKEQYDITPAGSRIMKNKMVLKYLVIRNCTPPQAIILKQEMLARGGECAIDKNVITTEWNKQDEKHDIVLIGTILQLENLVRKLKGQSLKLDFIASLIEDTLQKGENIKEMYSNSFDQYKYY